MITLDRLRYFSEVAKIEHLGNAAKSLHVSPSVLSSAIKVLEEELNCKLFTRSNNSLKLNENGWMLLEKATSILKESDSLYADIGSKKILEIKGHYRLAASPFLMKQYLVSSFMNVKKNNPKLTAEFISADTGIAVSQVLSGNIDMALVFRSVQHQDIYEEVIYEGSFQIAVKKGHNILKTDKKKRIGILNELPAITFRTSQGMNFCESHPVFKDHGIKPKHTYFYHDNNTSIELLNKTDGWALLPDIVIEANSKAVSPLVISNKWDAPMKVSLIRNKNNQSSMLFDNVLKELKAQFK